jgi:tRNA C32,U32 (ribose-2'-O)-methylase TrmJ
MGKLSNFISEWKEEVGVKIEICNQSIAWWESQLDSLYEKLDEIEDSEWHPEKDANTESIMDDIRSLMKRGRFEWDNLQVLQEEMDDMLEKIENEIAPKAMRLDINITL